MSQFSEALIEQMYAKMFEHFRLIAPVSPALESEIRKHTKVVFFKKKSIMLEHGAVCRYCYFCLQGLVRAYYVKEDGEHVTSWFMKEGNVVISVRSFFKQEKSREALEVLEDTICIALHNDLLERIYNEHPEFNYIGRELTEEYYMQMEERAFSLRMDSGEEKYRRLLENNPDIILRAPQNYVASYLGITQETLSRIKSGKY